MYFHSDANFNSVKFDFFVAEIIKNSVTDCAKFFDTPFLEVCL